MFSKVKYPVYHLGDDGCKQKAIYTTFIIGVDGMEESLAYDLQGHPIKGGCIHCESCGKELPNLHVEWINYHDAMIIETQWQGVKH